MSEREWTDYQIIIYLSGKYPNPYLLRYKELFLEYKYLMDKTAKLNEIISKSEENLRQFCSNKIDGSYALAQVCKHNITSARKEINKDIAKIEKITAKLKRLSSSKPIQEAIAQLW